MAGRRRLLTHTTPLLWMSGSQIALSSRYCPWSASNDNDQPRQSPLMLQPLPCLRASAHLHLEELDAALAEVELRHVHHEHAAPLFVPARQHPVRVRA